MSKVKNGGLDQYGAEPFEQQQFGKAGVERVKGFQFSVCTRYRTAARNTHVHAVAHRIRYIR